MSCPHCGQAALLDSDALKIAVGTMKKPLDEEKAMFDYERFGTCNLCSGPVRRHRKTKEVHCARCEAAPHDPGKYGPVVLMRRASDYDLETANYGGTD